MYIYEHICTHIKMGVGERGIGGQPDQDPSGCRAQRMALLGDKVEVQNGQAMLILRATEAI